MDSFTEVTEQSCLGRIASSFFGIIIGIVLILVAAFVLFKNEGRAVTTARSLTEGKGAVRTVPADKVAAANDGKLVYVNGEATTDETLTDPQYGVSARGLLLKRAVEMYQWQEEKHSSTHNKIGGGTETVTTYDYKKVWSSTPIDSAHFKHAAGHENPHDMPPAQSFVAKKVTLGAFTLPDELVRKIDRSEPLKPDKLPAAMSSRGMLTSDGFYLGSEPNTPGLGDVRLHFSIVKPTTVSVIAQQNGSSLAPYQTKAGDAIDMLQTGTQSPESMFKSAEEGNNTLTWILRVVGLVLMVVGIFSLFGPFVAVASVIPFLGELLDAGIFLFALVVGCFVSIIIVAVAWVVYRPLIGGTLIVAALALLVGGRSVFKK